MAEGSGKLGISEDEIDLADIREQDHVSLTSVLSTQHHDPSTQDVDKVDGYDAQQLVYALTVQDFQANAGTGTATDPANLNDGDTGTMTNLDAVGEYVEIDFGGKRYVKEFRYYGYNLHNQDGDYKIQYYDGAAWVDVHTAISTRLDSWSTWIALTSDFIAQKIRVVATTLDSYGLNVAAEWEMRGR